jgi:hypothetical protein
MIALPRSTTPRINFWGLVLVVLAATSPVGLAFAAGCPTHAPCSGCGCAGGPGYRAPDGHCVGFRELASKCGTPPTTHCTFENAPGTGANAECATRSGEHPP